MSKLKSSRHSKYNLNYHIVWIPKYRKPVLVKEVKQRLEPIFKEIAQEKEMEILAMEIQPDHLHMFVSAPPKQSPALIVNWLKGISARMYNHRFSPKIKWTRAYYVGTAGTVTTETIRKYIEEQSCKSKK
jgi:putative transposase